MYEHTPSIVHLITPYRYLNELESAISFLVESGCEMRSISIVAKSGPEVWPPVDVVEACERMSNWRVGGPYYWGSVWGPLFGSSDLMLPNFGSVTCAGWIASVLDQVRMHLYTPELSDVLRSIGIDEADIDAYERALRSGGLLLVRRVTLPTPSRLSQER